MKLSTHTIKRLKSLNKDQQFTHLLSKALYDVTNEVRNNEMIIKLSKRELEEIAYTTGAVPSLTVADNAKGYIEGYELKRRHVTLFFTTFDSVEEQLKDGRLEEEWIINRQESIGKETVYMLPPTGLVTAVLNDLDCLNVNMIDPRTGNRIVNKFNAYAVNGNYTTILFRTKTSKLRDKLAWIMSQEEACSDATELMFENIKFAEEEESGWI